MARGLPSALIGGFAESASAQVSGDCGAAGLIALRFPRTGACGGRTIVGFGTNPSGERESSPRRADKPATQAGTSVHGSWLCAIRSSSAFRMAPRSPETRYAVAVCGTHVLPPVPSGEFALPDAAIDDDAPVSFLVETREVPLTAEVRIHLLSENAAEQVSDPIVLTGSESQGNGSALMQVEPGFTRGYVRSTWGP